MTINRRRAPSSSISREKKISGHLRESDYATLIDGVAISGVQKADVKDKFGRLHSVKSGKKWQVFLYGYERISKSKHLEILKLCLDSFPTDSQKYFRDRTKCIKFKEDYVRENGKDKAKNLSNEIISKELGVNEYINSKNKLATHTLTVKNQLKDKKKLRLFLNEALFNNDEVHYLSIKDLTDSKFKVFFREDILDILTQQIFPEVSKAGNVPEDFNVAAQKTLLRYKKKNGKSKNIAEIEIRNDSDIHYRQVRFNMYSRDALSLLLDASNKLSSKKHKDEVVLYGEAIKMM